MLLNLKEKCDIKAVMLVIPELNPLVGNPACLQNAFLHCAIWCDVFAAWPLNAVLKYNLCIDFFKKLDRSVLYSLSLYLVHFVLIRNPACIDMYIFIKTPINFVCRTFQSTGISVNTQTKNPLALKALTPEQWKRLFSLS